MSIRREYSDSKLSQILKPKFDEDNLDNFLPKFLLKDIPKNEEGNLKEKYKGDLNDLEILESEGKAGKQIFDLSETDEISEYLRNLSMKENINPHIQYKQGDSKLKVPRSKFSSNIDIKQYAKDQKSQMYNQFQSQFQKPGNFNGANYNINYNISQNINQNINKAFQPGGNTVWNDANAIPHPQYVNFINSPMMGNSPQLMKICPSSLNDSGNFSLGEEHSNFLSLRPTPKRNNSSSNLKPSHSKGKSSLFHAEKDEKGEDFADLQELMNSISMNLWDYAKTQKGSRNLQKLLNKIQPESLDEILENLKNNFPELMIDTYGNYFCQKLIQSCSSEQRMFILRHIMKEFTDIACNPSGTHALQSMIEIINMPGEEELVKEAVKDNILRLSYDVNGTHVIQKVVTCIDEQNREFINFTVLNNIPKLVFDSNGICVLKKFINGNKSPKLRMFLLDEITKNALEIVQNPFGNYVIQHILDEWGPQVAKDIIDVIISTMISLSMQKFSSNVVEKCFDLVDMHTRKRMVKELFNAGKISSLLKNKYGNFVLQKAISVMTNDEKKEIKDYLAKRVGFTSNKEKARLTSLIEII